MLYVVAKEKNVMASALHKVIIEGLINAIGGLDDSNKVVVGHL